MLVIPSDVRAGLPPFTLIPENLQNYCTQALITILMIFFLSFPCIIGGYCTDDTLTTLVYTLYLLYNTQHSAHLLEPR